MEPTTPSPSPDDSKPPLPPVAPSGVNADDIRKHRNYTIESASAPGEEIIFSTHKHPIGIIILYLQAVLVLLLGGGLVFWLLPDLLGSERTLELQSAILLGFVFLAGVVGLILLLLTYIYQQNKLILTTHNVTQIIQSGLFNRQVSELALGDIEDVSADKRGILAMIFDYGEVRVETAGEQNNFRFAYCPRPNQHGQMLLAARQQFLNARQHANHEYHNE